MQNAALQYENADEVGIDCASLIDCENSSTLTC